MRRFIPLLVLIALSGSVSSQEGCSFILEEAQEMFDAGLIESVPDKLAGCLESGLRAEEKIQAYKLVILSYLYDDNFEEADATMLRFLSDFPSYEPVATDPMEFLKLKETYDTRPVLLMGASFGINFSFPFVPDAARMGTTDFVKHPGEYSPGGPGINISFRLDKRIGPALYLSGGFLSMSNRYEYKLEAESDHVGFTGDITDFSIIGYRETQNRMALPVGLSYVFAEGDFKPFVAAGISPGMLIAATANGTRDYSTTGTFRYNPVSVVNEDVLPARKIFFMMIYAGAGFSYKLGPGELFLDTRYYLNFQNQVRANNRFDGRMAFDILYVSDNFSLNSLAFTVGYLFPVFNPKKIQN
jgi:hypothetical protein